MKALQLSKNEYSEIVIRRALYWLSRDGNWTLQETAESWVVELEDADLVRNLEFALVRNLNDELLREKIDIQTRGLKKSIIIKVLRDLDSSL